MKKGLLLVVALSLGATAWLLRPLEPAAWRALAAEPDDAALVAQLVWSGYEGRVVENRWTHFLEAVGEGEPLALALARRVCPKTDADVGEQLLDAIARNLDTRPEAALEAISQCVRPEVLCTVEGAPDELTRRQRAALRAVLDGGLGAQAAECLDALRPPRE